MSRLPQLLAVVIDTQFEAGDPPRFCVARRNAWGYTTGVMDCPTREIAEREARRLQDQYDRGVNKEIVVSKHEPYQLALAFFETETAL